MRPRIKPAVYAASIAIVLGGFGAGGGFAASPNTKTQGAPVGHRQPSAKDVKSGQDTSKDGQDTSAEQARDKMDQELDRKVKSICRGC